MSEIRHQWNGSILTVISDSGASSADLRGHKGDTGPRGPQGPGGVIYNEDGELVLDLSEYYSRSEVDTLIENVEVDLSDYATHADVLETLANEIEHGEDLASKNYVSTEIAKAQLEGAGVDTSGFATKDDLENYATKEEAANIHVDGTTIVKNKNGAISTTLGGSITQVLAMSEPNISFDEHLSNGGNGFSEPLVATITNPDDFIKVNEYVCFEVTYSDGNIDLIVGSFSKIDTSQCDIVLSQEHTITKYTTRVSLRLQTVDGVLRQGFIPFISYDASDEAKNTPIVKFTVSRGTVPGGKINPINPEFIPVDGVTIIIQNGKLVCVGGGEGLPSSEEVFY